MEELMSGDLMLGVFGSTVDRAVCIALELEKKSSP